ncbi:hypothetical protein [Halobacillus sp. K22]|uniref:hypothetical protein n=1 Tax=Halobacillus sp. K22 TaxID=3457431 RepID=UPI003FCC4E51
MKEFILNNLSRVKAELLYSEACEKHSRINQQSRLAGMELAYSNMLFICTGNQTFIDFKDKEQAKKFVDQSVKQHVRKGFRVGNEALDKLLIMKYLPDNARY